MIGRLALLLAIATLGLVPGDRAAVAAQAVQAVCPGPTLTDVTDAAGVRFVHDSGAVGEYHEPETFGAGIAWIDFDADGRLDLYAVQSGAFPPRGGNDAANRLFRNVDGTHFVQVEGAAGAAHRGYGQGAYAADVNGDGLDDLFLTNYGPDALYLNRGGSFEEVTEAAGLAGSGWSSAAAFADVDADGDLDLYVAGYLEYDVADHPYCRAADGKPDYCHPQLFNGAVDAFYLNSGDGTFVAATEAAGLAVAAGKGLGAVFADLDADGDPDLYVANDNTPNFLFENLHDGRFADVSLFSGAALNSAGQAEAGMGVGVADVDGDGLPDLAVTHFDVETNTLYRNLGALQFEDVSAVSGFGLPSFNLLGFGIALADLNGDLHDDAFVANGHVLERPEREGVGHAQRALLLLGDGTGQFSEGRCAVDAVGPGVGRGVARADYDNDGDLDLALAYNGGALRLLRNDSDPAAWVGVVLQSGAAVTLEYSDPVSGRVHRVSRWLTHGDSYLSSSDPRALFTVSESWRMALEIRRPDGTLQRLVVTPEMLGRYTSVGAADR